MSVFDDVMQVLNSGNNTVDMVYLDFAKAFEKVDHGVLLHNIKMLGITGKFGVPQDTMLGPLLFIILMCDINSGITFSSIVSFADDTRLYYCCIFGLLKYTHYMCWWRLAISAGGPLICMSVSV